MQGQGVDRPTILHLFTPGRQASPFDVNMAVDAGYQVVVPYADVDLENLAALTQDAIFSRGPKGVRKTGIFIGGRDVVVANDMLELAQKSMFPPFVVSAFADPSGSYTTAAAMIACVERELRKANAATFDGKRVLVLGGTGAVGRICGVLCARAGAGVRLCSHSDVKRAKAAADLLNLRFDVKMEGAFVDSSAALRRELTEADVVPAAARGFRQHACRGCRHDQDRCHRFRNPPARMAVANAACVEPARVLRRPPPPPPARAPSPWPRESR